MNTAAVSTGVDYEERGCASLPRSIGDRFPTRTNLHISDTDVHRDLKGNIIIVAMILHAADPTN